MDVSNRDKLDMLYVSEETDVNVAYVNTHAQLEVMRDEALSSLQPGEEGAADATTVEGPRVLLAGPPDCGKSSLARVLTAYATKLGRTPLLVDLDAAQSMLSVPGALAAAPASADGVSAAGYGASAVGAAAPLVLWYGAPDLAAHPALYKAQLTRLGTAIDARLAGDVEARASGLLVDTAGEIEDAGYDGLLHAITALRINVVLVLGHDRLYSRLGTHFQREAAEAARQWQEGSSYAGAITGKEGTTTREASRRPTVKLIKLPRSGGVVARDAAWRRAERARCVKRYFYGAGVPPKPPAAADGGAPSASVAAPRHRYSPSLLEVSFDDIHLHRCASVSLSASLLPISAKQSTDPIQLTDVTSAEITPKFQHALLAVCHPGAVERYEESGSARDLYLAGVAGFVAVEKVDAARGVLSLLSPCAGSLPSSHLLVGDIFWLE